MPPDSEEISTGERVLVAIILGVLGFVTGLIAVSVFSDLPGLPIPWATYIVVAVVSGVACSVAGYRFSDKTIDALGDVWQVLWKLSLGILDVIRSIVR